jgi:glycosyltransferase A (GT-A) superfamily protein (DUF2064 family)
VPEALPGRAALADALVAHAVEWARGISEPTVIAPDQLRAAINRAGAAIVVAANTPRLEAVHAEAVRSDLAAGVELTLGPGLVGGWYLAGLSGPHEAAITLLEAGAGREETFKLGNDLAFGMLRAERVIREESDCYAFAVDPLLPQAMRSLMR